MFSNKNVIFGIIDSKENKGTATFSVKRDESAKVISCYMKR